MPSPFETPPPLVGITDEEGYVKLTRQEFDQLVGWLERFAKNVSDNYISLSNVDNATLSNVTLVNATIDGSTNTLSNIAVSSLATGTTGDMLYWNASGAPTILPIGADQATLAVDTDVPGWD